MRFFEYADLFFVPMLMMMSVLAPGFLGSMSSMSMKESFAAHLGQQVSLSLSLCVSVCLAHACRYMSSVD